MKKLGIRGHRVSTYEVPRYIQTQNIKILGVYRHRKEVLRKYMYSIREAAS